MSEVIDAVQPTSEPAATTTEPTVQTAPAKTEPQGEVKPTTEGETKAPAEVEYKFEAPEGVNLDEGSLTEFKSIAKELSLSQDAASKVVALAIKREQQAADAFQAQVKAWGEKVSADPVLGKPEALSAAKAVVDTYGTPALKDLLTSTGLGNHPEVVGLFHRLSKLTTEDKVVVGRTGTTPTDKMTNLLYPTQA